MIINKRSVLNYNYILYLYNIKFEKKIDARVKFSERVLLTEQRVQSWNSAIDFREASLLAYTR